MSKSGRGLFMVMITVMAVLALTVSSYAMMGMPGGTGTSTGGSSVTGGMMNNVSGMMGGAMMTNGGSFGMMNGMAGAPVVGDDGTAFMMSFNPTAAAGTTPSSNSFESNIVAVMPSGQTMSITLKGIASRPVIEGNVMVATASLPDLSNYSMMHDYSSGVAGSQSVGYVMQLPLSSSTVPQAVVMDGAFASVPVIAGNHVYVVTSDYGSSMMTGNSTFSSMMGNYNFNSSGTAKSYLYVFNMDGTLFSKTTIQ